MKNISFHQVHTYPDAKSIKIVNHMAPLTITASETGELEITAEIKYNDHIDDINLEDYVQLELDGQQISLELEEIDDLADSSFRRDDFKLIIAIPQLDTVWLEAENESFNVAGLNSKIKLEIENGATVISNCSGDLNLESENGAIKIRNHQGNVTVEMENGPLSTDSLKGDKLSVTSENGSIKMRSCSFTEARITNENGVIYYETLPVDDARLNFENENGVIQLVLPSLWGFEIHMEQEMGSINNKLEVPVIKGEGFHSIMSGDGGAKISIKTENGAIKLSHDRHLNLDYLQSKIEQLKDAILKSKTMEDKEKVSALLENIIAYANRGLDGINEDKIKQVLSDAMAKLKKTVENIDFNAAKDKVAVSVENIGVEIQTAFKDLIQSIQDKANQEKIKGFKDKVFSTHFHFDADEAGAAISAKVMEKIKRIMPSAFELKDKEKEDIADQSRLKILQMLESGKITAEEAERLLKAISKE